MEELVPWKYLTPNCTKSHAWNRLPDEQCRRYNSFDTDTTAALQPVLRDELRRNDQLDFYQQWWEIVYPVMRMQRRGFGCIDRAELARVNKDIHIELDEVQAGVMKECSIFSDLHREAEEWLVENREAHPTWKAKLTKGYESRKRKAREREEKFWNYSNDMRAFVFDHMGFKPAPPSKRENRAANSLSDSALRYIYEHLRAKDQPCKWIIEDLSHLNRLRTILRMFVNPIYRQPDWLRDWTPYPTFKLYGAETLRWAVARPPLHGWPPRMRPIIRARPGMVFIAADYSQIEAGIAALLAGDQAEIDEWLDPDGDLHRLMACDALGLSRAQWDNLEPDRRNSIRQMFKTGRYERIYGGEGTKARAKEGCFCPRCREEETGTAQKYTLSRMELSAAMQRWSRKHPKMVDWRKKHIESIQSNGNSWVSPFGYRMVSCQPMDIAIRQWFNKPMQHSVAMIINRAVVDLDRAGCPLVFQHHDQIFGEVPEKEGERWKDLMVEVMTQPIPEFGGTRFPVDAKIGYTWTEVK